MIRLFFNLSKHFNKKSLNVFSLSELDILKNEFLCIDAYKLRCSHCNAKHSMSLFGSYKRNFVTYDCGVVTSSLVTIPRYICSSCKHTHAAISSVIVPYMSFSFNFVISLFKAFFSKEFPNIEALCLHFDISVSTFYRSFKKFKEHKALQLGLLKNISTSDSDFIIYIFSLNYLVLLHFKFSFFKLLGFSFFQLNFTLPET